MSVRDAIWPKSITANHLFFLFALKANTEKVAMKIRNDNKAPKTVLFCNKSIKLHRHLLLRLQDAKKTATCQTFPKHNANHLTQELLCDLAPFLILEERDDSIKLKLIGE